VSLLAVVIRQVRQDKRSAGVTTESNSQPEPVT
jgi:hypothetical protein